MSVCQRGRMTSRKDTAAIWEENRIGNRGRPVIYGSKKKTFPASHHIRVRKMRKRLLILSVYQMCCRASRIQRRVPRTSSWHFSCAEAQFISAISERRRKWRFYFRYKWKLDRLCSGGIHLIHYSQEMRNELSQRRSYPWN